MKKRIFLLVFISLLLLAGCNQAEDEPSVPYCPPPICWRSEEDFLADKASKFQNGEFDYGTLLRAVPATDGVAFGRVNECEGIEGSYYYEFVVRDEKEAEEAYIRVDIDLSPDSYESYIEDHGRDAGKCWVEGVLYDPLYNQWTVFYNGRCIQFRFSESLKFESPKQIWDYIAIEKYPLPKE